MAFVRSTRHALFGFPMPHSALASVMLLGSMWHPPRGPRMSRAGQVPWLLTWMAHLQVPWLLTWMAHLLPLDAVYLVSRAPMMTQTPHDDMMSRPP
jgi:hypothetical protein